MGLQRNISAQATLITWAEFSAPVLAGGLGELLLNPEGLLGRLRAQAKVHEPKKTWASKQSFSTIVEGGRGFAGIVRRQVS